MHYSLPKTIDGHLVPAMPRLPVGRASDARKRREFAYSMYLGSERTHRKLPTSPALCANHACPTNESEYPDPPSPRAMLEHVLSYLPVAVTSDFAAAGMTVDVLRSNSMNLSLRRGEYYPRKRKYERVLRDTNGLFVPDERRILLREGTYPVIQPTGEVAWEHVEDILGHEVGHFVDWASGWASIDDRDFLHAYVRERRRLDPYTASTSSEFFATTCWITARFPELSRRYIPRAFQWFNDFFADCR